jgi:hypothetical protein
VKRDPDLGKFFSDAEKAKALADQNKSMLGFLSKADEEDEDWATFVEAEVDRLGDEHDALLQTIQARDGEPTEEEQDLLEAWEAEIASHQTVGPEPFPERVGDRVNPQVQRLANATNSTQTQIIHDRHQDISLLFQSIYQKMQDSAEHERSTYLRDQWATIQQQVKALGAQKKNIEKLKL